MRNASHPLQLQRAHSSRGAKVVDRTNPAVGGAPNAFFVEDMAVTPAAPLVAHPLWG